MTENHCTPHKTCTQTHLKLIKDLGTRKIKGGTTKRYGIYECPVCKTQWETRTEYVTANNPRQCKSCNTAERNYKHGHSVRGNTSPCYSVWAGMIKRCTNKKEKSYKNYGGRGINVCERWTYSFENFYYDMGDRPSDKYSIDRHDNNKGYNPCNCYWATVTAQNLNQRIRRDNKSGLRGVSYDKKSRKYVACIQYKKVEIFRKYFDSAIDASIARDEFIVKNKLPHILNNINLSL